MKSTNFNSANAIRNLTIKYDKTQMLTRLLKLNLPHLRRIILASICVLLVNGALLLEPYILKIVIDNFLTKHEIQKGFYSLNGMGILYFVVVAFSCFFNIAQVNLINKAGQEIIGIFAVKFLKQYSYFHFGI